MNNNNNNSTTKFTEIDKVINDNFHGTHVLMDNVKYNNQYNEYEIKEFEKEHNVKVFNSKYVAIKNSDMFNYVVDFYSLN